MDRSVNEVERHSGHDRTRDDENELAESMELAARHLRGEDVGLHSRTLTIDVPLAQAARRMSGLSQAEFSARLGISVGTLRNWEQGRREPSGPAKALINLILRRPEVLAVVDARVDID